MCKLLEILVCMRPSATSVYEALRYRELAVCSLVPSGLIHTSSLRSHTHRYRVLAVFSPSALSSVSSTCAVAMAEYSNVIVT